MKTTNLELSKQLKEAGYRQVAYLYHIQYSDDPQTNRSTLATYSNLDFEYQHPDKEHDKRRFASPTADELLDQLPSILKGKFLNLYKRVDGWHISYELPDRFFHREVETDLADAAAKMWLYLKKQNLL